MPWSSGRRHPACGQFMGLNSECRDPTRAVQAPCTCRTHEGNTCIPLCRPPSGGSLPDRLCPSNLSLGTKSQMPSLNCISQTHQFFDQNILTALRRCLEFSDSQGCVYTQL